MYQFHSESPEDRAYFDRAVQDRVEAQARVAYLLLVGVDAVAAFIGRAVVSGPRRIVRGYGAWRRRRRTAQELSRLDDRMLRDIGILPGSIDEIAAELAYDTGAVPASQVADRLAAAATPPRLQLDVDCPNLKHAA